MNLSVIIPVYNDPDGIRDTLETCVNQSYDDYEVIPVDNDSDDETGIICAQYGRMYDHVHPVEEPQPGSYAARNRGIRAAEGDVLVFMDADMTADDDWLAQVADRFFADPDLDYLGYDVDVYRPKGTFWDWLDSQLGLPVGYYMREKHFAPTCALAVRADVFADLGGFIPTLRSGGDKEFGIRCWQAGYTCAYDDDIVVRHPGRATLRSQLRKNARVGTGLVDLMHLGVDDEDESRLPIPDYLLPPDPRRLRETLDDDRQGALLAAFVGRSILSYTQVAAGGWYLATRWLRGGRPVGEPKPLGGDG